MNFNFQGVSLFERRFQCRRGHVVAPEDRGVFIGIILPTALWPWGRLSLLTLKTLH